jgi:hypothetical protein
MKKQMAADLIAVMERDPACEKYSQPLLYFKGFQALQAYRVSHLLWTQGRKSLALALQSRVSEVFQVVRVVRTRSRSRWVFVILGKLKKSSRRVRPRVYKCRTLCPLTEQ